MSRVRETTYAVRALVRKDLLLEPVSRRIRFIYTTLVCCFLLWAGISPGSVWISQPVAAGISTASQVFISLAIASTFFVPFLVYLSLIQGERRVSSFLILRALPIDPGFLFWGRVISCWLLSMTPVSVAYALLAFMHASGLLVEDLLTPILLGIRFPLFLVALTWFSSTLAVGLAMNVNPQLLPFVATTIGVMLVLLPILLSPMIMGIDLTSLLIKMVQMYGTLLKASGVFALLSLFFGSLSSKLFRRKRSYV